MGMRIIRQIIISLVYLVIIGGISYAIYSHSKPVPTCNDGSKNGQEEGVDCGVAACGVACIPELIPFDVKSIQLLRVGLQDYDFVADIANPNKQYGASDVSYELTLLDNATQVISKQNGNFYILPGEEKHIIVTAIKSATEVKTAQIKIISAHWQELDSLGGTNFLVRNKAYDVLSGGSSSELNAILANNSDFDFAKVDIGIVLLNDKNEILAVNQSDARTLLAHTERAFNAIWPFFIAGKVTRINIEVTTNLFDNLDYVKRYGPSTEEFQKYYY